MPFDPSNPDDGYPNDWFVPWRPSPFSALSTASPTFPEPSNTFNPFLTPPPSLPNSISSFWGYPSAQSPRAGAWMPPTFPDAFGRFPPPPPPLPAVPPLPNDLFSDALKMLAERSRSAPGGIFGNTAWGLARASGATPSFGGGPFDPPANQQSTASGTPANTPSQPASYWPALPSFTTPDPISNPGGNSLLASLRSNLSYATSGSLAQDQPRTDDPSDAVSGTSAGSDDPNVILIGGSGEEEEEREREQQRRARAIFEERAFGITPPLGNTAPRLLPPLGGGGSGSGPRRGASGGCFPRTGGATGACKHAAARVHAARRFATRLRGW